MHLQLAAQFVRITSISLSLSENEDTLIVVWKLKQSKYVFCHLNETFDARENVIIIQHFPISIQSVE